MIIAPSILSADFSKLAEEVKEVEAHGAGMIHIDVMDGHFVPNISFGAVVYRWLKDKTKLPMDVHIMIENPEKYALEFIKAGADFLVFHYEATQDPLSLIQFIKSQHVKAGISIKPNTPVSVLEPLLRYVDIILIMSVEPGFGGQQFMMQAVEKLQYLKNMKKKHSYEYLIEVDGGINLETAKIAKDAGAEVLVVGSYLFAHKNRKKIIEGLKSI
jgi:ribulose-phosphate 3-epimerase